MKKITLAAFIGLFLLLLTGCKPESHEIQGYVDARYIYVASTIGGGLEALFVNRGDQVTANQPLFTLDPEPQQSQLAQAESRIVYATNALKAAESNLRLAEEKLKDHKNDETRNRHDQATAARQQAIADLDNAKAALTQVQWQVDQKKIEAPQSGVVFDTYYTPGEIIPANQPVLSLLSPEGVYVIFYIPAKTLSDIKLGQEVRIEASGLSTPIDAKITYISPKTEYTPPVIYSNETNYKLVYRVEATPLAPSERLHPGQPVQIILTEK